jgi:hypothetical protein
MSALTPKADIRWPRCNVRFAPEADIRTKHCTKQKDRLSAAFPKIQPGVISHSLTRILLRVRLRRCGTSQTGERDGFIWIAKAAN